MFDGVGWFGVEWSGVKGGERGLVEGWMGGAMGVG